MVNQPKNYMTEHGHNRLISERDQLLKIERPDVTKTVAWAASLGDRSENADYIYGKKRLREIDRRIAFLNSRLNNAQIVNPEDIKSDKVQFSACVTVCDENDVMKTYTIVGEDESSPKDGLISWRSPIGMKLLGRGIGDCIKVQAPGGECEYEIVKIVYGPINFPNQ